MFLSVLNDNIALIGKQTIDNVAFSYQYKYHYKVYFEQFKFIFIKSLFPKKVNVKIIYDKAFELEKLSYKIIRTRKPLK